jgi:tetratricopeptide (TPR) repeat protein
VVGARRLALAFLFLVACRAAADAPAPDELRTKAEAAFHDGVQLSAKTPNDARQRFAASAALYEQLREAGVASALLYRDQGNAYFLAGDLPRAILAYRRGLRLVPNDLELWHNLGTARQEVKLPPPGTLGRPPVDHRPPWLPRLPEWILPVALGLYAAGCLAWARWWMVRRGRGLMMGGALFLLAALLGAALALEAWDDDRDRQRPLVVIAEEGVLLRRGNGQSYPARFETPLPRGAEGRLIHERGDWLQIELSGGEIGWVPRKYAVVDSTT